MEICPLYDTSIIPRETEYRVPLMDRSICLVANDMIIETLAGGALVVRMRITFNNNRVRREVFKKEKNKPKREKKRKEKLLIQLVHLRRLIAGERN